LDFYFLDFQQRLILFITALHIIGQTLDMVIMSYQFHGPGFKVIGKEVTGLEVTGNIRG
jgi:uncharacterized protein YqhQ